LVLPEGVPGVLLAQAVGDHDPGDLRDVGQGDGPESRDHVPNHLCDRDVHVQGHRRNLGVRVGAEVVVVDPNPALGDDLDREGIPSVDRDVPVHGVAEVRLSREQRLHHVQLADLLGDAVADDAPPLVRGQQDDLGLSLLEKLVALDVHVVR